MVEAVGLFQVRHVADAVVPGGLAVGQVASTCSAIAGSTTVSARPCVTSNGTEGVEDVVVVDVAGGEVGADPRRTMTFQQIAVSRSSAGSGRQARTKQRIGADVGRQVVGGEVGEVVEEAGADQRAEAASPSLTAPPTKLMAAMGPGRRRAGSRR